MADHFKSGASAEGCDKAVVKVEPGPALFLFLLNVIFPGFGTICSAFMDHEHTNTTALMYGILQLITSWLIIGWFWSVYHGYLIYKKANHH